jgi:predicted RND superfamily exporter protein
MVKKLLQGISYLCLHHYRKILLISFIVFGIAFVLAGKIRFDPNFLKLFPAERGPVKLYMENLQEAGTFDLLFILIEKKEGVDTQQLIESGREIAENLKNLETGGRKAFKSVRFQKKRIGREPSPPSRFSLPILISLLIKGIFPK